MQTFFVKSEMIEIGKHVEQEVGTGEFKRNLLGAKKEIKVKETVWIKTGNSDCFVDGALTAKKLEAKLKEIEALGLSVVSIEPVISGNWKYETGSLRNEHGMLVKTQTNAGGWGYGYGYSYTDGYIIIAK
jgi:hypothetical protein